MIRALGIKKTGILLLSMTVLMTSVFLTEQAFAGFTPDLDIPQSCDECEGQFQQCLENPLTTDQFCQDWLNACIAALCRAIGGDMIQMETTSVLAAGTQYTAAWMIPVLVSAIGIGIVIARKF